MAEPSQAPNTEPTSPSSSVVMAPNALLRTARGSGAIAGAVAGGLIGSQFGEDGGRVAATAIGAVIGASIGIKRIERADLSVERIMKNVDLALYQAKSDGRNCIRVFESGMETVYRVRRELAADLISAIELNEIRLVYQPIVRSLDFKIDAMEALIRWEHPTKGQVSPLFIIDIAEETGLIFPIGGWVLEHACRQSVAADLSAS